MYQTCTSREPNVMHWYPHLPRWLYVVPKGELLSLGLSALDLRTFPHMKISDNLSDQNGRILTWVQALSERRLQMPEENICKVCSTLQLLQPALIDGASYRITSHRNMYCPTSNCRPFLCYSDSVRGSCGWNNSQHSRVLEHVFEVLLSIISCHRHVHSPTYGARRC